MIRHSRLVLSLSVVAAMAAHAAGLWVADPHEKIEIEAGAGAVEARLGSSFADMVAGAAQPVSDSTVTPNRQSDQVVEPTEPGAALRPEVPEAAQTPPPERSEAAPAEEVIPQTPPEDARKAPEPAEVVAAAPIETAATADITDAVDAVIPEARETQAQDIDNAIKPELKTALRPETVPDPVPPEEAQTSSSDKVDARSPEQVIDAAPEAKEGLQVSRRPEARPRAVEEAAAARQAPKPERKTQARGTSGNNAARDATRGSASGTETATAARQGRNTASQSEAQGNAAASNYPGEVMRHLARVPRPRADARGAALVQFTIANGGHLASVGLARSSGSSRLDRAALTVVQRAAPFPAPPRGAQRRFSVKIEGR